MVPYILTNTIDYPVAGEDWIQKFKEFYQGRIIEGFLDSTAFLRKLHDTFNLNEIALGELPEDACSYLFGCRKIEEHVTGKGLDPENYEDRAWFVKEDDRSEVFYRYQRQRNIIQISQSPYQYLPQKEMQVYIVRTKDQTGFDSNNQLMN